MTPAFRVRTLMLTTALLSLSAAATVSAQVVILQSRGPSATEYYAGRVLSSTHKIHLKQGDKLQIKVGDETRTVTGPGDPATEQPTSVIAVLKSFLSEDKTHYQDVTAARGIGQDDPQRDNIWLIDVSSGTTFCVAPDVKPSMVRWNTQYDAKVLIEAGEGHPEVHLEWPAGAATLEWPDSLPMKDDKSYLVHVDDRDAVKLTWRRIDSPAVGVVHFAKQLRQNGCRQQFDTLTASIEP